MKMAFALAAFAAAISQTAASGQQAPEPERPASSYRVAIRGVPAEQRGPLHYTTLKDLILLPVEIGGTRILAVVDTGSGGSTIDAGLIEAMGLQTTEASPTFTDGGSTMRRRLASDVAMTVVGGYVITFETVSVQDLSPLRALGSDEVKAVIGMDVLKGGRFSIEPCSRRFMLSNTASPPPSTPPYRRVSLHRGSKGEPQLAARIGSEDAILTIDTGQDHPLSLRSDVWAQFVPAGNLTITGSSTGLDGRLRETRRTWVDALQVAGETFSPVRTTERDLPGSWAEGAIGMGILKDYQFSIDPTAGSLWLVPAMTRNAEGKCTRDVAPDN